MVRRISSIEPSKPAFAGKYLCFFRTTSCVRGLMGGKEWTDCWCHSATWAYINSLGSTTTPSQLQRRQPWRCLGGNILVLCSQLLEILGKVWYSCKTSLFKSWKQTAIVFPRNRGYQITLQGTTYHIQPWEVRKKLRLKRAGLKRG